MEGSSKLKTRRRFSSLVSILGLMAALMSFGCGEREVDISVSLVTSSCPDRDGNVVHALAHARFLQFEVNGAGMDGPVQSNSTIKEGKAVIPSVPITGTGGAVTRSIQVTARSSLNPEDPILARGGAVVTIDADTDSIEVPIFLRPLDDFVFTASAESPETCSQMNRSRSGHTATVLRDGRVLIVGGAIIEEGKRIVHASAEIYDPKTGEFRMLEGDAAPRQPRVFHTATLLRDGRVVVAGGEYDPTDSSEPQANRSAEIFDPVTDSFGPPVQMPRARTRHTATALTGDMVVLAGGYSDLGLPSGGDHPLPTDTVDVLFFSFGDDEVVFEEAMDLKSPRAEHCAVRSPDATRVVLAGGKTVKDDEVVVSGTLQYLRAWPEESRVSLLGSEQAILNPRYGAGCGVTWREDTPGHQIIMAGGFRDLDGLEGGLDSATANVEIFDSSASQTNQTLGGMDGDARGWLCSAQVDNRSVAFVGGYGEGSTMAASAADWVRLKEAGLSVRSVERRMNDSRYHHQCTLLLDGSVLVTGGQYSEPVAGGGDGTLSLGSAEVFTPKGL